MDMEYFDCIQATDAGLLAGRLGMDSNEIKLVHRMPVSDLAKNIDIHTTSYAVPNLSFAGPAREKIPRYTLLIQFCFE